LQPCKRFVEIGRVGLINYGEDYGKLIVIVDVIDQNLVRPFFQRVLLIICLEAERIMKGKK
jgi:ribosomal protein L14E/L6E/L27E